MLKREGWMLAGAAGVGVGFVCGLWLLLQWRMEQGDIYPAYSTYRADPMGAKALYESLQQLPGVDVRRNAIPLSRWTEVRAQTILVLGLSRDSWILEEEIFLERLEQIAADGGRVVLSWNAMANRTGEGNDPDRDGASEAEPPEKSHEPHGAFWSLVESEWGVKLNPEAEIVDGRDDLKEQAVRAGTGSDGDPPEKCPWKGGMWFEEPDEAWEVVYAKAGQPVVIQREWGEGRLILAADSYPFSNESLWRERPTRFLRWVLGSQPRIIFDEVHLRMIKSPGIASLGRQYRLQGVILVLIVVAGLFVWKNAMGFPPPQSDTGEAAGNVVRGKDAAGGYVNLLRRNLPSKELLPTMFEEWKKSGGRTGHVPEELKRRMQLEIEREQRKPWKDRDPVGTYRKLCCMLRENRRRLRPAEQETSARRASHSNVGTTTGG